MTEAVSKAPKRNSPTRAMEESSTVWELYNVRSLLQAVDDVAFPMGGEDAVTVKSVGIVSRNHLKVGCGWMVGRLLA